MAAIILHQNQIPVQVVIQVVREVIQVAEVIRQEEDIQVVVIQGVAEVIQNK
jgi:hypothetical protein